MNTDAILAVKNLSYRVGPGTKRGTKLILNNVNLTFKAGELTGLIGANGAGKSTLLRHLSGYLPCQEGEVVLQGKAIGAWTDKERAKQVAWVSQDAPSAFNFSVEELVAMGRYPHVGSFSALGPDDWTLVRDQIRFVGLEEQGTQI